MYKFGSYSEEDVIFLLKDVSELIKEQSNEERERLIQNGKHYSEMIPIEYEPPKSYIDLYEEILEKVKYDLTTYIAIMSEKIYKKYKETTIIVSLARAGTPIGILSKRYLKWRYNIDIPHYSVSIIRDKGLDSNAIKYIREKHVDGNIQFVDGWTGKGTITNELIKTCKELNYKYNWNIDSGLAVISDPAGCCEIYGIREDFLIPSSLLNSTISGLLSRTICSEDIIGENDFHGAKYYKDLLDKDKSNEYIDYITNIFDEIDLDFIDKRVNEDLSNITMQGELDIKFIENKYNVEDINFIKPGIGETTRVLLRRIPDRVIVNNTQDPRLEHIFELAKDKNVKVEEVKLNSYLCCGIIKNLKDV